MNHEDIKNESGGDAVEGDKVEGDKVEETPPAETPAETDAPAEGGDGEEKSG